MDPMRCKVLLGCLCLSLVVLAQICLIGFGTVGSYKDQETPLPGQYYDSDGLIHSQQTSAERGRYQRMPDCLIIGVRKGGTRALLDAMALHPMIRVARKEVHFFDYNDAYRKGTEWYREQMPFAEAQQLTVEKTPGYFTSELAPERVYKTNPNIKIILILRDPVVRTISDFTQVYYTKKERHKTVPKFENVAFLSNSTAINTLYKPVRNSLYAEHLKRWLKYFNLSQILILDGDRFITDPFSELQKVETFLNLPHQIDMSQFVFNAEKGFFCFRRDAIRQARCLGNTKGRQHVRISRETQALLAKNFRPHNRKFFRLVNRYWKWNTHVIDVLNIKSIMLSRSSAARILYQARSFSLTAGRCAAPAAAKKPEKKASLPQDTDSFCMNLFRGKANLKQVFPYPVDLNDERRETLNMILGGTEKFLEEVNDVVKNDENASIPKEVLAQFAEYGAFGALVPEEYEGAGLNNTQMARLAEVVGSHDLGLGVVMGAHQSIGYKGVLLYGNEEQKQKYLPDLATGRKFAAFCLTEPSSGSDANSIRSRAVLSPDGKHYILNGSKIWISNGGFAEVFTVFAQTPVELPDGSVKDKVSAFVVERGFGGVTSGPPEKKMGIKGSNTAEVYFENVKIPVENMLGAKGEGFKVAMNILNNGRFGIPAAMTGAMKHCIQKTIEHITTRTQFGRKLEEFGNVQEKLTDMIVRHYATESIVYMLAANMDRGIQEYQLEAAIGKVMGSENAWIVCDNAIQLHGGMGFMKECGLERVLRDIRIFRIFEGANDVMRLFIGLTGMQHAGKHLQHTVKQVSSGNVSALFGEVMRRASRSTGGDFSSVVHPSLKSSAALADAAIAHFGKTVETLLTKHRKNIIDRQYEVSRVAQAAIDIYSMIAVLSRCTRTLNSAGGDQNHEQQIAELFVRQASRRAIEQLKEADGATLDDLPYITSIAKDVCKNHALNQVHPIDV
ncbi:hypothetical protein QR680_000161 [Steinernema hermaphroditum]|uniref:Very long-chain specific acyl-CoA dehydrogenase, mitochondrial n=1 Tax=Steinernema hermaphroditum TaxID=289476 RepID=A0AA39GUE4_9BILA|nr:hypothetical protein QR680_000161 [Steinernema hermaphroditum]